jgi:tetraacyldisaccharide 4'-kinase
VKLWPLHPDALAVPLELEVDPAFLAALDVRLAPWRAAPLSSSSA